VGSLQIEFGDAVEFLKQIIKLTGLPQEALERELDRLILNRGFDPDNLSPENIREILAAYMQETLLEVKQELSDEIPET
jgi:hypothetical protein